MTHPSLGPIIGDRSRAHTRVSVGPVHCPPPTGDCPPPGIATRSTISEMGSVATSPCTRPAAAAALHSTDQQPSRRQR